MTNKKFTDDEIIKALEYCNAGRTDCDKCVLKRKCESYPFHSAVAEYALDLINRQKLEIERLQKEVNLVSIQFQDLQERTDEVKPEAYKECLEKVKKYIMTHCNPYGKPDFEYDTSIKILNFINNLVKEMAGE